MSLAKSYPPSIRDHILHAPTLQKLLAYFTDVCLHVKPAPGTRRAWQEAYDQRKGQLMAQTIVSLPGEASGCLLGANGKPIRG